MLTGCWQRQHAPPHAILAAREAPRCAWLLATRRGGVASQASTRLLQQAFALPHDCEVHLHVGGKDELDDRLAQPYKVVLGHCKEGVVRVLMMQARGTGAKLKQMDLLLSTQQFVNNTVR